MPHSFRHAYAIHLLEAVTDMRLRRGCHQFPTGVALSISVLSQPLPASEVDQRSKPLVVCIIQVQR